MCERQLTTCICDEDTEEAYPLSLLPATLYGRITCSLKNQVLAAILQHNPRSSDIANKA